MEYLLYTHASLGGALYVFRTDLLRDDRPLFWRYWCLPLRT